MMVFSAKETFFKCNMRQYLGKKLSIFTKENDREWLACAGGILPDRAPSRSVGGEVWDSGFAHHSGGVSPVLPICPAVADALSARKAKNPQLFEISSRELNKKLIAQIKASKLSNEVKQELVNWNTFQRGQPKILTTELIIKTDKDCVTRLEFKDIIMYAMFDEAKKSEYAYHNSTLKQIYKEVINPVLAELISKEVQKIYSSKQDKATKEPYDFFSLICIHGSKANEVLYKELCTRESLAQTQAEFDKIKAQSDLIVARWKTIMQSRESAEAYVNGCQDKLTTAKIEHQNELARLLEVD